MRHDLLADLVGNWVILLLEGEANYNVKRGVLSHYSDDQRFDKVFQIQDRIILADDKAHQVQYIFEAERVVWIAIDPNPGEDDELAEPAGALSPEDLALLGISKP